MANNQEWSRSASPEEQERLEALARMEQEQREQHGLTSDFLFGSDLPATDGIAGLVGAVEDDRRRKQHREDGPTL